MSKGPICVHGIPFNESCRDCFGVHDSGLASRDCEHGQLARTCEVCERDATIERYQHQVLDQLAEIERLEGLIYDFWYTRESSAFSVLEEADRIAKKREGK